VKPQVWGVINVTPDSFSDGGRFLAQEAALAQARRLTAAGADVLDIGGESTRPGAEPVSADQELERVLPLIEAVQRESPVRLSIDTMKPEVARAAVAAGASVWNDVSALRHGPESATVAAELGCEVVLMHMQGEPRTMQENPQYQDVVGEVRDFLSHRAEAAMAAGVAREKIWLDPGIGFGKTLDHNLELLRNLDRLAELDFPLLLGVSRKRSIQAIDSTAIDTDDRLGGSLALALWSAAHGADALRVHDVRETVQALKVWAALGVASE
jgi:dihydropteroate synthase